MKVDEQRLPFFDGESVIYSAREDSQLEAHPWTTGAYWQGEWWAALVEPGFVNDVVPLVALPDAEIAAQGLPANGGQVELWDEPLVPLRSWRQIFDPVPPYFRALGVRGTNGLVIDGESVVLDVTQRPGEIPDRALFAMDMTIAVARASYAAALQFVDGTGTSGQFVDLGVTFDTSTLDRLGARARLAFVSEHVPVRPPTMVERLLGSYSDDGEDREKLATIYMLAPAGVLEGPPGSDWEPFVACTPFGCWNLLHEELNPMPPQKLAQVRLFTGLAGGLGDDIVNRSLAFLNAQADAVNAAVNSTNNKGSFSSV